MKRNSRYRRCPVTLLVGLLLSTSIGAAAADAIPPAAGSDASACKLMQVAELPMQPNPDGMIIVPVGLDHQPSSLALDTGAFWSVLNETAVKGQGTYHSGIRAGGATGGSVGDYVELPTFQLGTLLDLKKVDFFVTPVADAGEHPTEYGSLGSNILKSFDVDVDPGHTRVRLFLPKHCPGKVIYWPNQDAVTIPFRFDNNWITIPVELDGKPIRALIDTGASTSVLNLDAARSTFGLTPKSPDVSPFGDARDIQGQPLKLYKHRFHSLRIGDILFNQPWLAIGDADVENYDASRDRTDAPELILGMHELRLLHFYIAYGEKTVYASTVTGDAEAANEAGNALPSPARISLQVNPLDVSNANPFVESARAHFRNHEFDAAEKDLDQALFYLPNDAGLLQNRGYARMIRHENEGAIADFGRAIGLNPSDKQGYLDRGALYQSMGDPEHALADFNRVLELDPQDEQAKSACAVALRTRSLARQMVGDADGARADNDAAARLDQGVATPSAKPAQPVTGTSTP